MRTRNNLEYSFMDHIKEDLQKMYKALKKLRKDWDFTYFDGEIYNPDIPFEEISGKSRIKKPKKDDLKIIASLKLYLFDMFSLKDLDEPFSKRYALLHHLFQIVKPKHLVLVKNQIINKPKDICAIFDKYMAEGYEGIMVRNQKASYKSSESGLLFGAIVFLRSRAFERRAQKSKRLKPAMFYVGSTIPNFNDNNDIDDW